MRKKYDSLLYCILAVFFVASCANTFYLGRGGGDLSIEATRDGRLIMAVPLDKIAVPTLTFGEPGNFNEIAVEGGVRMVSADCPGGDCLRTGMIGIAGEVIVCVPHRFVIRLVSSRMPLVDATSY
jgi:hypothetical protein